MSSQQYLGMTAPISLASPDAADMERSRALEKALEPHGVFESEQELSHRMEVLARLNELVKEWIKELSTQKNMPPNVAETVGGHVYTPSDRTVSEFTTRELILTPSVLRLGIFTAKTTLGENKHFRIY